VGPNFVISVIWGKFAASLRYQPPRYRPRTYAALILAALALALAPAFFLPFVVLPHNYLIWLPLMALEGFFLLFGLVFIFMVYEKRGLLLLAFSTLMLIWFRAVAEPMFYSRAGDSLLLCFFIGFMSAWVTIGFMIFKYAKLQA
jgi:hypothetical protein